MVPDHFDGLLPVFVLQQRVRSIVEQQLQDFQVFVIRRNVQSRSLLSIQVQVHLCVFEQKLHELLQIFVNQNVEWSPPFFSHLVYALLVVLQCQVFYNFQVSGETSIVNGLPATLSGSLPGIQVYGLLQSEQVVVFDGLDDLRMVGLSSYRQHASLLLIKTYF